jgi:hypothetical protein
MNQLAAALPDEPRWLEPRGMLLTGRSTIFGGTTVEDGFVVRLVHGAFSAMAVVGRPPCEAILSAIDGTTALTPIVAQTVDAAHVAQCLESADQAWSGERAILHLLTAPAPRPAPAPHLDVRLLTHGDSLDHLPAGLRHEMTHAQDVAPVAAVFVEGRSSSFCYVEAFEDNGGVRVIAVLDAERKRAVPRERKMTTAAVAEPVVLRRAPFNTGAALVASGLILIGALYLALTYTWRQAALFLVGAGAGVVLYHAAFWLHLGVETTDRCSAASCADRCRRAACPC